jgi:hypothetical protein
MAATSTKSRNFIPDLDAAGDQVREANDRMTAASRRFTGAYLDGVERYVEGLAKAERKFGEQSQVELVSSLLNAHASLTEDFVKAGISVTRELIAA